MIITVGMEKGGDGKSTIATNLAAMMAIAGHDVLLLDSDPQGSSYLWNSVRNENPDLPKITCFQKFGRIREDISRVKSKFDHIIIDTPGKKSVELQSALLISDLLVLPFSVGYFDAWALRTMEEVVGQAMVVNEELVCKVLVNKANTSNLVDDRQEAMAVLSNYTLINDLFRTVIHERRIYRYASGSGKSVTELPKSGKASEEITNLYKEILP